jgi:hypothetical protein
VTNSTTVGIRWRLKTSLPLNHLRRRFRVDLKEQILKARAKSPTVCRPKFVDLEFTGKFLRVGRMAVSGSIGINRLRAALA